MTIEAATPIKIYMVAGIGPYALPWPYFAGSVTAAVEASGLRIALTPDAMYSLDPVSSLTTGNLFLDPITAAAYAGSRLVIERQTPGEQGWAGIQGDRERGLEVQLDRLTMSLQELAAIAATSLRISGTPLEEIVLQDGAVPQWDATASAFISGPTASQISAAEADALAAQVSAATALGALASFYQSYLGVAASDPTVDLNGGPLQPGATYFSTSTNSWRVYTGGAWVTAVAAGAGVLFAANNLSDIANAATARANLGLTKQTTASDATAGRVLTVGAFGWGSDDPPQLADIDDATAVSGLYNSSGGGTSSYPFGGDLSIILVQHLDMVAGTSVSQLATRSVAPFDMARRTYSAGVWSPWVAIADALTAMPLAKPGAGIVGEQLRVNAPTAGDLVAPAGGTWWYLYFGQNNSTMVVGASGIGVTSGGATVRAGYANSELTGYFWKVQ